MATAGLLCPSVEIGPDGAFEVQDLAPGRLSVMIHGERGVARETLEGQPGAARVWDAQLGPDDGEGAVIDGWDE